MLLRRALPWLLRGWWAALPFTAGPALAAALHPASAAVRTVASIGLWGAWALGLAATVVPHPIGLTAIRLIAPAGLAAALASSTGTGSSALAVGWTAVTAAWSLTPAVGLYCVNGPAYPNERRFPLRAPAPLLVGPIMLAWALAIAGVGGGPLLLAARQWVWGTLAVLVGVPVAVVLVRSLHVLSKRWAVFVPAGLVLVDPLGLTDSLLLRRRVLRSIRAASAGTTALDLTQRAPGLALEAVLAEEVEVGIVRPGRTSGDTRTASRLLFTPTLPGSLLEEAAARRLPA